MVGGWRIKKHKFFLCIVFDLHYLYGCRREGRRRFGNKNKEFILYFSHLALPLNKVGCVSTMPVKNIRFSFVLSSTCTTSTAFAVKVGGGSEIKINDFILYFSHLALPLYHERNDVCMCGKLLRRLSALSRGPMDGALGAGSVVSLCHIGGQCGGVLPDRLKNAKKLLSLLLVLSMVLGMAAVVAGYQVVK